MPLPAAVLVMALLLAGLVGYGALLFRVSGLIRSTLARRGYKSPFAHPLVGTTAFLAVFAVTLGLEGMFGGIDPLWLAGAAFLLVPGAFVALAHLLPARAPRSAGRRVVRFPYRGGGAQAGLTLLGACPALLLVGAVCGGGAGGARRSHRAGGRLRVSLHRETGRGRPRVRCAH